MRIFVERAPAEGVPNNSYCTYDKHHRPPNGDLKRGILPQSHFKVTFRTRLKSFESCCFVLDLLRVTS